MKSFKKILKAIGILLLVIIIVWLIILFWHYPRYVKNKEVIQIDTTISTDEIRVMDYNIRSLHTYRQRFVLAFRNTRSHE